MSMCSLMCMPLLESLPQGTCDLPQCCSCQSGRLVVPGSFCSNQSTGQGCALGPFGLKNSKCAFPWWGLYLEIYGKKSCFGKILMTVWEQGKFLSATSSSYVIYSFLRHLLRADICRHNTWLFLSNFLKWYWVESFKKKNETLQCLYR